MFPCIPSEGWFGFRSWSTYPSFLLDFRLHVRHYFLLYVLYKDVSVHQR